MNHDRLHFGAEIVPLDQFEKLRPKLGKIVATSVPGDPIHPGHISLMMEAKELGDNLVVIVNGDWFLRQKKGKPFQDLTTRCLIISALRPVDIVVPFEIEGDMSVNEALKVIKPAIFAKGGDTKDRKTIREWDTCQELGIEVKTEVGHHKLWSSSDFLKDWEDHRQKN